MRILTIDLGSSATKAALWSEEGLVAAARTPVNVEHPHPGWAEQDPEEWWTSTVTACAHLPEDERLQVDAVGFSTQRETFVPVTTAGEPVGRAILWSGSSRTLHLGYPLRTYPPTLTQ